MTGMPAFKDSLSETQLWQVSLLVANANKLPEPATRILSTPLTAMPTRATAPQKKQ